MPTAAPRRLPGFAFETTAPAPGVVLPRMDIALFIGFAASGPVNTPVAVEDAAQFAAIFGADARLAWDEELGRHATAHLGPAVRLFFANGGRRCWVVRVARGALTSALPVPGVAALTFRNGDDRTIETLQPLFLNARSPGSWSGDIELATSLTAQRFGVMGWNAATREADVTGPADAPLAVGDLLHLSWTDGVELYAGVEALAGDGAAPGGRRRSRQTVRLGQGQVFDAAAAVASGVGEAEFSRGRVDAQLPAPTTSPPTDEGLTSIVLAVSAADAPRPGEVIVATFGDADLLLAVREVMPDGSEGSPPASPPGAGVVVRGAGLWRQRAMPVVVPAAPPTVRRLALDLWARTGD